MTPIYQALIRRDAHTTTPVTIPEYEVPILQEMFGTENVHNAEGKRIDEVGIGTPVSEFRSSDDEYLRLSAKYGSERVEEVYGKKATKALADAIKLAKKKKFKPADAKNPDDPKNLAESNLPQE